MGNMIGAISVLAAASGVSTFNYNTAFYICLALGVVLLICAVVMFFALDIPSVYLVSSGKGAKKTIKKMEEVNAETGRLRKEEAHPIINTPTPNNITDEMPTEEAAGHRRTRSAKAANDGKASEPFITPPQEQPETTLLSSEIKQSGNLKNTAYVRKTAGRFELVYNVIMIHTDEII